MRRAILIAPILAAFLFLAAAHAAGDEGCGGFRLSLDSLPFFSDSNESDDDQYSRQYDEEPTEYTYDATGRKVPARTERSGIASPIR